MASDGASRTLRGLVRPLKHLAQRFRLAHVVGETTRDAPANKVCPSLRAMDEETLEIVGLAFPGRAGVAEEKSEEDQRGVEQGGALGLIEFHRAVEVDAVDEMGMEGSGRGDGD